MNYPSDTSPLVKQAAPANQLNASAQALNASIKALADGVANALPLSGGAMTGPIFAPGYGFALNLIGGWHLNNAAADYSGNGSNGTWIGGYSYVPGKTLANAPSGTQYAANFTGSNYILASGANLPLGGASRSIAVWFKTTADNHGMVAYGVSESSEFGHQFEVFTEGTLGLGNYGSSLVGSVPVEDGNWHFGVITYSSGIVSIYVDGDLDNSGSIPYGINTLSSKLIIGGNSFGGYNPDWVGQIEEVQIYDFALTPAQVSLLYNSGAGYYGVNPSIPAQTAPLITYDNFSSAIQLSPALCLTPQTTAPTPVAGGIYFDGGTFYFCADGTSWSPLSL
jgi:hypothetical protein